LPSRHWHGSICASYPLQESMNLKRLIPSFIAAAFCLSTHHANASPEVEFWQWFQQHDERLFEFERDQERTFDELTAEMHKVHPSLTFEFGPKHGGRREFVISADGIRDAFPKVESLYAAAPPLPRWKVLKFRQRHSPFDIQYGDLDVKANTVLVALKRHGPKVDLIVYLPGYVAARHETYTGIAYLFLDQALGEYDVETRVDGIGVRPMSTDARDAFSLDRLPAAFDAALGRL
jgi:hypothetical protein